MPHQSALNAQDQPSTKAAVGLMLRSQPGQSGQHSAVHAATAKIRVFPVAAATLSAEARNGMRVVAEAICTPQLEDSFCIVILHSMICITSQLSGSQANVTCIFHSCPRLQSSPFGKPFLIRLSSRLAPQVEYSQKIGTLKRFLLVSAF